MIMASDPTVTYDNPTSVLATGIALPVLGLIAVICRFLAKWQDKRQVFDIDDWICIPALVCFFRNLLHLYAFLLYTSLTVADLITITSRYLCGRKVDCLLLGRRLIRSDGTRPCTTIQWTSFSTTNPV